MYEGGVETHRLLVVVIVLAFSLWLAYGVALNVREIMQSNEWGIAHTGPARANLEVLQYLRETPADVPVLSNSLILYLHIRSQEVDYLTTHIDDSDSGRKLNPGARRQIENEADGTYVIWLHSLASDYDYSIKKLPHLEPIAELSDGIIFKVNRTYDAISE